MCPKSEGVSVKLIVVTALAEWEGERHFCQPKSADDMVRMAQAIVGGVGCAALSVVPEGVPFGVGLSMGRFVFQPAGDVPWSVNKLPADMQRFVDIFPMKFRGRRGRRGGKL